MLANRSVWKDWPPEGVLPSDSGVDTNAIRKTVVLLMKDVGLLSQSTIWVDVRIELAIKAARKIIAEWEA